MAMPHGTPWWLPPILAAGLSLMSALYVGKLKTTADTATRITALEAHQVDMTSRLDRIEAKIDRITDALVAR
jgi:hypothetical protein